MCNVGAISRLLLLCCIIPLSFCFRKNGKTRLPGHTRSFNISARKYRANKQHWGPLTRGRKPTEADFDEFVEDIFSNPAFKANEEKVEPKTHGTAIKNENVLKGLGSKHYQGILDEISTEVSVRLRREKEDNKTDADLTQEHGKANKSTPKTDSPNSNANTYFHGLTRKTKFVANNNFPTVKVLDSKYILDGLKYRNLGESDLVVSELGIGTSMYDNPELIDHDHAVEILDTAHKRYGLNFFDTCEYDPYPYEPRSYLEGQHRSMNEFLRSVSREDVVISGRISSSNLGKFHTSGRFLSWVRDDISSPPSLSVIERALDKFLARLGTDYLDILSFVHPYRYVPNAHLGEDTYCWGHERNVFTGAAPESADVPGYDADELLAAQCEIFEKLVAKGKVRAIGLSNETVWGLYQITQKSDRKFPIACTQQMYNLLHRNELESSGISEAVLKEHLNCPVVAYGVLAGGILTGKYIDPERHNPMGADKTKDRASLADANDYPRDYEIPEDYGHLHYGPANARCNLFPDTFHTHRTVWSQHATAEYLKVARTHGMTLAQLSLSWAITRPFIASTLVAPRSIGQLHETIAAMNYPMTQEIERDIHELFLRYRAPTMGGPQLLTRLDDDLPVTMSQNERLRRGNVPIWSGGSHWDMDNIPTVQRIANERNHEAEYTQILSLFGLLDKPNDDCWKNYRCWVERINEGLPGEYFAVKESKILGWDIMKLDEFTLVPKTPEEVARDDTSDFHFYWKGGQIYVAPTSDAIKQFYEDRVAICNVIHGREEAFRAGLGTNQLPEGMSIWSPLDADLVFKRLKEKFDIDITEPRLLENLLFDCGKDVVTLSADERRCEKFAYYENRKHILNRDLPADSDDDRPQGAP
ncbi:oxidoreductase aldo keto reductase domain containing protein, putative [Babesia ovis]|uniref:Oxidoreductase aldo keto reductase domain containing protein, putative n=1 Tax=Babesia ovis TaxID=5869 RepID=A0A9W5WTN2_BABOV|nr:oxidoreductase aldo keto reductase domain containing protein, putative [Babesia ovis]